MLPISQTRYSNRPMEATLIKASTVNLQDTYVTMTNTQVHEPGRALDSLRSNCSLAALVDAKERYDSPRCAEATRRDIIQKIEDWVRHDSVRCPPSSLFWLYGGAGVGKSALAQTLAEKFKTNEDLAASFFFFKADLNRNDGDRLIPTLAHQLVQTIQGLPPFIEQSIQQHPDLFQKNCQSQMLELVVEPLMRLSLEETDGVQPNASLKSHPRLVVIDGLDECSNPDTQCDLLRIISKAIPHFPYPLRFLITSRPEPHINRAFRDDVGEVAQYDLSADSNADEDIRRFLEGEFTKICCTHPLRQYLPSPSQWPPRGSVNSLVEQSSGLFIYASTVIRFIQSPKHRPDDRLEVILGLKQPYEQDQPYARLDSLYTSIFREIQDPGQLEKIHRALGIIHLRSLKSGLFSLSRFASNSHATSALLELKPGSIDLIFADILSLVSFDKGDIRISHKSLFEYLLDSSRSGELQLDLGLAHENAANYIVLGKQSEGPGGWDSAEFQQFAYHCQFARLNDVLTGHLRSLACDSKTVFNDSFSELLVPSKHFSLLQTILYFLHVIGRQDFDSTGHCYRTYVANMVRHLRSVVHWSRRFKNKIPGLLPDVISEFKGRFRSSFQVSHKVFASKSLQLGARTSIQVPVGTNTNVLKSIEREHEVFSSYVEARYRQPDIPDSFLESSAELIHSCHFVIRGSASMAYSVPFVMLVTYSQCGVRLSCTEFDGPTFLNTHYLVKQHLQRTRNEVDNNHITVYS